MFQRAISGEAERAIESLSYKDIFSKRGAQYTTAMTMFPAARRAEFDAALRALDLREGQALLDAPCGGGYFRDHIPKDIGVVVTELDPTDDFVRGRPSGHRNTTIFSPLEKTPFGSESFDSVLSIAGLHHNQDLDSVAKEFHRLLRPNGKLVVLEVDTGSRVDEFLNGFVNEYNSQGHVGNFVSTAFLQSFTGNGLLLLHDYTEEYEWSFFDDESMIRFCRLIFGLDLATDQVIHSAITDILGKESSSFGCALKWSLRVMIFGCAKRGCNTNSSMLPR